MIWYLGIACSITIPTQNFEPEFYCLNRVSFRRGKFYRIKSKKFLNASMN